MAHVDSFGNVINIYKTAMDAANALNLKSCSINAVCLGKRSSLFNNNFKYV